MKFSELLEIVADEPVFETGFLRAGRAADPGLASQLSRWCRGGKLFQLRRGLYALAPPFRKVRPHPFLVANHLVPGSYVSGLSALAHAHAIPEFVPEVTSCGPGAPAGREHASRTVLPPAHRAVAAFRIPGGGGGGLRELGRDQWAFVATPEKAFLDLVHLRPHGDDPAWVNELRLNGEVFSAERLTATAAATGRPKLVRAAAHLRSRMSDRSLAFETLAFDCGVAP